eukprot:690565-Rhodomonas_salina.1
MFELAQASKQDGDNGTPKKLQALIDRSATLRSSARVGVASANTSAPPQQQANNQARRGAHAIDDGVARGVQKPKLPARQIISHLPEPRADASASAAHGDGGSLHPRSRDESSVPVNARNRLEQQPGGRQTGVQSPPLSPRSSRRERRPTTKVVEAVDSLVYLKHGRSRLPDITH